MITFQEIADTINKNGRFWIAFTGASTVSCEWVHPNWREIVEYALQEEMTKFFGEWHKSEWGIKGFNFGYDGATTKDILDKIENIKLISPDLVISMMGGNDELFGIDISQHIKNIKNIIKKLDTKVVWSTSIASGSSDKNKRYEPYARSCTEIAENENLQLINMFDIYKSFPLDRFYTFKSEENVKEHVKKGDIDFIHPNQLGNAYIAKVFLKEVFGIDFDPELYWKDTLAGEKFPKY
jgi:lysophospholipase L1-like esterase